MLTSQTSLVSPLPFRGDFRPYFTVYDPDCRHYAALQNAGAAGLPALVLGVTNPIFLKMLDKVCCCHFARTLCALFLGTLTDFFSCFVPL